MAKVVADEEAWGPKTPRGKVMDWRRYCDGQSWRLERGVDVDADKSMHSKRSSFRQWAARQGLDMDRVHTSVVDDRFLLIKVEVEAWPNGVGEYPFPAQRPGAGVEETPIEGQRARRRAASTANREVQAQARYDALPERVKAVGERMAPRDRTSEIRERDV